MGTGGLGLYSGMIIEMIKSIVITTYGGDRNKSSRYVFLILPITNLLKSETLPVHIFYTSKLLLFHCILEFLVHADCTSKTHTT